MAEIYSSSEIENCLRIITDCVNEELWNAKEIAADEREEKEMPP